MKYNQITIYIIRISPSPNKLYFSGVKIELFQRHVILLGLFFLYISKGYFKLRLTPTQLLQSAFVIYKAIPVSTSTFLPYSGKWDSIHLPPYHSPIWWRLPDHYHDQLWCNCHHIPMQMCIRDRFNCMRTIPLASRFVDILRMAK